MLGGAASLLKVFCIDWFVGFSFGLLAKMKARESFKKVLVLAVILVYLRGYKEIVLSRKPNIYNKLGLKAHASTKQIRRASREVALRHHPDRSSDHSQVFIELNEYLRILGNRDLKYIYDRFGLSRGDLNHSSSTTKIFLEKYLKMMVQFAHLLVQIIISSLLQRHYRLYPVFVAYISFIIAVHLLLFSLDSRVLALISIAFGSSTPHQLTRLVLENFSLLVVFVHHYEALFYEAKNEAARRKLLELREYAEHKLKELTLNEGKAD